MGGGGRGEGGVCKMFSPLSSPGGVAKRDRSCMQYAENAR
jgi:hypothetical protein